MIQSISISNVATYGIEPERMYDLRKLNFIFGSNGTGKTTISRIIANETADEYCDCSVNWSNGNSLETFVFNRDFIQHNFDQSEQIKGVFTLGEENIDILKKIKAAKDEIDVLGENISSGRIQLEGEDGNSGKLGTLKALEDELEETCWAQKRKHEGNFKAAFKGSLTKRKFREKILEELESNSEILFSLEALEKKAETVFGSDPEKEDRIPTINASAVLAHEGNSILAKRVIGKQDVDIARMITRLGNSDWVKDGRLFYEANDGICPFCQQPTPESFAKSLGEYFDETFERDSEKVVSLITEYKEDTENLLGKVNSIIDSTSKFLDLEQLKVQKEVLDSKVEVNLRILEEKKKEPSRAVALEPIGTIVEAIQNIIDSANKQIAEHNEIVNSLARKRRELTKQVWRYLLEELKSDLESYEKKKRDLNAAIESMNKKIANHRKEKKEKEARIKKLEKKTTSIQPTIDDINSILKSFGFHGFALAGTDDDISYKLIREDGSDAKDTLSEGEKGFITFLYFYHLLKGSQTSSGVNTDRVVVFDDPVSSLDSDVLFVVSHLIKRIFRDVRERTGLTKQVFVLTHNIYFHREVTFQKNRSCEDVMKDESFWTIRKSSRRSCLKHHDSNPVKTSYELLWAEVRNPDRSSLTIQNTLRRILENYFKILGGFSFDRICEEFSGNDKIICRSLFSWIHHGSHYTLDDLHISTTEPMVDSYLKVFKEIFDKTNHIEHYKMMMRET